MAHFIEHVIDVISKQPGKRTDEEVVEILPWLRKRSNTLYQQTKAVLKNLIRNCYYRKSPRDDLLIRQGELGDCMYIILRGTISVYVDPSMSGEDEGFSPVPKSPTKRGAGPHSPMGIQRRASMDRAKYGKHTARYESGKSFGEVALLSEDAIRKASIITDTDCDFMVVGKELFDASLKEYEERSYAECRHFVHTHPFFSKMSQRFKRLLTLSLRKEKYGFDSTLVKQGEPVIGLHFIRNGQAKIYMEPERHRHQYPQLWPFEAANDIYSIEFDWLRDSRKKAILRKYREPGTILTKTDTVDLRRKRGYAAVEKRLHEKSVNLCGVQNGEVIGDTEICLGLQTYMQTVECTTETEVFILEMKNYDRLVGRKNPNTIRMMKKLVESKLGTRKDLKYSQQIPLLKFLHYKLTEETLPESKKLPPLKTTKSAPAIEQERQYILENYRAGKTPLVDTKVPGGVYYKNLMREKARIRENISKRGNTFEAPYKRKLRNPNRRQPRSRREIVESLQQMLEADLLMYNKPKRMKMSVTTGSVQADGMSDTASRRTSVSEPGSRSTSVSRKLKPLHGSTGSLNTDPDDASSVNDDVSSKKSYTHKFVPKPPSEPNSGKSTPKRGSASPVSARSNDGEKKADRVSPISSEPSVKIIHGPTPPTSARVPQLPETTTVLPPIREDTAEQLLSREKTDPKGATLVKTIISEPTVELREATAETTDMPMPREILEPLNPPVYREPPPDFQAAQMVTGPRPDARSAASSSQSKWKPAMQFVQERIHDRFLTQLVDKEPTYADYDTSENTLSYLESRIRSFHIKYGNKNKMILKLPKLRRFKSDVEEPETQPLPGGKVFIRKKLCQFANQQVQVKGHKHVRYHMVDSLPQFDDVKKTQMIMNFLLSAKKQTETAKANLSQQSITFAPEG